MPYHIPRLALTSLLDLVGPVAPRNPKKEVLKNIRLTITPDGLLRLQATDEEISLDVQMTGVRVERETGGLEVLIGPRFAQIVKSSTQDEVTLSLTKDGLLFYQCGMSEFRLSSEDPALFPVIELGTKNGGWVTGPEPAKLAEGIRQVIFSCDDDSTRYALGGVLFEACDNLLNLVATDGRRMALKRLANGTMPGDGSFAPVIPSKGMAELEKLCRGADSIEYMLQSSQMVFRTPTATLCCRLVEGRFPRYQDVIPGEATTTVNGVAGSLLSAIKQAMICTNAESRGVDFVFIDGTLELKTSTADIGNSTIQVPVSLTGSWITVTLDPQFVADFLRVLPSSAGVEIGLTDPNAAVTLRWGSEYTCVVMPLARD